MSIDPRLTLVLTTMALAATFSTSSWPRLALLAVTALSLLVLTGSFAIFATRVRWLRWFLLLILVLHLLLSPGYTLFGQVWLSRDGLIRGLLVDLQIVTALGYSLLLWRSTTPERLAAALTWLLRPIGLLGADVKGAAGQVLLTLQFVPVLQEEGSALMEEIGSVRKAASGFAVAGVIAQLQRLIPPVLVALVDRADVMAREFAAGHRRFPEPDTLPAFYPLSRSGWLATGFAVLIVFLFRGLP